MAYDILVCFQHTNIPHVLETLHTSVNIMVWGQYRLAHPSLLDAFSDDTGKIV